MATDTALPKRTTGTGAEATAAPIVPKLAAPPAPTAAPAMQLREFITSNRYLVAGAIAMNPKYEVSRFTRYEAVNGGAKCRKWGGLRWLGGTQDQRQCHHSIERI